MDHSDMPRIDAALAEIEAYLAKHGLDAALRQPVGDGAHRILLGGPRAELGFRQLLNPAVEDVLRGRGGDARRIQPRQFVLPT
jgi:hypothetical protein